MNQHQLTAVLGSPHAGGPFVPLGGMVCQAHWQKLESHPGRCLERFKTDQSFKTVKLCQNVLPRGMCSVASTRPICHNPSNISNISNMRIQGAHLDVDSFVILSDGIFGESDEGIGMATQRHHGLDQDTHGDAIVERHLGSIPALDRSECEHTS